jgi:hypothetical protein
VKNCTCLQGIAFLEIFGIELQRKARKPNECKCKILNGMNIVALGSKQYLYLYKEVPRMPSVYFGTNLQNMPFKLHLLLLLALASMPVMSFPFAHSTNGLFIQKKK